MIQVFRPPKREKKRKKMVAWWHSTAVICDSCEVMILGPMHLGSSWPPVESVMIRMLPRMLVVSLWTTTAATDHDEMWERPNQLRARCLLNIQLSTNKKRSYCICSASTLLINWIFGHSWFKSIMINVERWHHLQIFWPLKRRSFGGFFLRILLNTCKYHLKEPQLKPSNIQRHDRVSFSNKNARMSIQCEPDVFDNNIVFTLSASLQVTAKNSRSLPKTAQFSNKTTLW